MKVLAVLLLATLLLADAWPFIGREERDTEHQLTENKESENKPLERQPRDAEKPVEKGAAEANKSGPASNPNIKLYREGVLNARTGRLDRRSVIGVETGQRNQRETEQGASSLTESQRRQLWDARHERDSDTVQSGVNAHETKTGTESRQNRDTEAKTVKEEAKEFQQQREQRDTERKLENQEENQGVRREHRGTSELGESSGVPAGKTETGAHSRQQRDAGAAQEGVEMKASPKAHSEAETRQHRDTEKQEAVAGQQEQRGSERHQRDTSHHEERKLEAGVGMTHREQRDTEKKEGLNAAHAEQASSRQQRETEKTKEVHTNVKESTRHEREAVKQPVGGLNAAATMHKESVNRENRDADTKKTQEEAIKATEKTHPGRVRRQFSGGINARLG